MSAVLTAKDFATATPSWWCPGCGDYGVLAALKSALAELGQESEGRRVRLRDRLLGKDQRLPALVRVSRRSRTRAPGRNRGQAREQDLTVIAAGGDGDGYAIGAGHFIHAVRRNPDVTYIVMDNQTYGLTKGQSSPTSPTGYVTGTSPNGNPEAPINGLAVALAAGATFLARGFSAQPKQLVDLLKQAIEHKGFSIVEVSRRASPTTRSTRTRGSRRTCFYVDETYDPTDKVEAFKLLMAEGKDAARHFLPVTTRPTLEELALLGDQKRPVVHQPLNGDLRRFASIQEAYR